MAEKNEFSLFENRIKADFPKLQFVLLPPAAVLPSSRQKTLTFVLVIVYSSNAGRLSAESRFLPHASTRTTNNTLRKPMGEVEGEGVFCRKKRPTLPQPSVDSALFAGAVAAVSAPRIFATRCRKCPRSEVRVVSAGSRFADPVQSQ